MTQRNKIKRKEHRSDVETAAAGASAIWGGAILAAAGAAGGYALWKNRFRIQRFLEANGVPTPWMSGSLTDAVQSGVAKATGKIEHELDSESELGSKAV